MFTNFLFTVIAASQNFNIDKHLQHVIPEKFQVEFEYDYHEEGQGNNEKGEKGNLIVNKNQYRINFDDREIICNGEKMWHYNKKSNKPVNVINEVDDEDNPLLLITNYKKYFTPENVVKKNNLYIIKMIPKQNEDNDLDIKYFEIICDDKFVQQLNIFNEDNSWMSIRFFHWDVKKNIPNKLFSFDHKKNNAKIVEIN